MTRLIPLSEQQLKTLRYISMGKTDVAIGLAMNVTPRTVGRHVRDILTKLGARNRAHAIHIAHMNELL